MFWMSFITTSQTPNYSSPTKTGRTLLGFAPWAPSIWPCITLWAPMLHDSSKNDLPPQSCLFNYAVCVEGAMNQFQLFLENPSMTSPSTFNNSTVCPPCSPIGSISQIPRAPMPQPLPSQSLYEQRAQRRMKTHYNLQQCVLTPSIRCLINQAPTTPVPPLQHELTTHVPSPRRHEPQQSK